MQQCRRQAVQLLDDALAKVPGDEQAQLRAFLLLQKAGWLRESGYPQDAAKTLNDVARELDRLPRPGRETEWSSLRMEQGLGAQQRGDLEAAEPLLAEAETLARQSAARDLLLPDILANRASLYLDQGRLGEAQDVLLAALEVDRRVGNVGNESNDLNMLGLVYQHLGDLETARAYLTKAFELAYENGLTRKATEAMTNLAALMDLAGDHEGAAKVFRDVGRLAADGGDDSGMACSVANRGVAAALAGDLEGAVPLFLRSYEMHLAAGNWIHGVQDQLNLSQVEQRRGHLDQALSYAEEALAAAREHGLVEMLWRTEYVAATCRMELAKNSTDESAGIGGFQEALEGLRRAADVVELLRAKVDRPEERESLLTDKEAIYETAISLCLGLKRARDAFQFCERARMRSFLEALGSSRLERLEADDPRTERRDQLVARLLDPLAPAREKPRLMDELHTLRAETMARRPALAAITEAELPTEDDIMGAIPAETRVLEYFQVGPSVILFLLDQDGLKDCHLVTFAEPLGAVIQRFRDEIDAGDAELVTGNTLFAEIGIEMGRFPSAAHLVSWANLAPTTKASAGKTKSSSTGKGNPWIGATIGEAAMGASRTKTFLGSRYRRIVKRRGTKRALVAVGNQVLTIAYHLLSDPRPVSPTSAPTSTTACTPNAEPGS